MLKNVIWLYNILSIGGVEEFEYQLVKKYNRDITIYYSIGDENQLKRLRKYCRVVKWDGKPIECERLFTNYAINPFIDKVTAKEYIQVLHADYKTQNITPHLHEKFTKYVAVSETVKKSFIELTGIDESMVVVSYNPLTIDEEERKPVLMIGSFTRLSKEKGKNRMVALIRKLDAIPNFHYLWFIYTNDSKEIHSPNVVYQTHRLDGILNIMSTMDIVAQLSDCEGWCYTANQAKTLGLPMLYTPCTSFKEMGLNENDDIRLEFDLSNIDEVVDKLVKLYNSKPIRKSKFKPKEDIWGELFTDDESEYLKLLNKKTRIRALPQFEKVTDNDVGRTRKCGEEWEVNQIRLEELLKAQKEMNKQLFEIVEGEKDGK